MIFISEELLEQIRAEGERCYPEECCGIILGSSGSSKHAEELEPVANSATEREKNHHFLIPAEIMLQVERRAGKEGKNIIGFFHSHPDCPAFPSLYDKDCALPAYSYVIVSVMGGKARDVKSWELTCYKQEPEFYREIILSEEERS